LRAEPRSDSTIHYMPYPSLGSKTLRPNWRLSAITLI
jgi:hypothetical protein